MDTDELPKRPEAIAVPGPAAPRARPRADRARLATPLLTLLVIAMATALVVALTVSLYPFGNRPAAQVPAAAVPQAPVTPPLTVLPVGVAVIGCTDPRSYSDEFLLCPGDLTGAWNYDGGLAQAQGLPVPRCDTALGGEPVAWVDLNDSAVHVHELVGRYASPAAALVALGKLSGPPLTALCGNLAAADRAKVSGVTLAPHEGAARIVAWSVPAGARSWTMIVVAVGNDVIRLDVTLVAASTANVSVVALQEIANAAVERHLSGSAHLQVTPTVH